MKLLGMARALEEQIDQPDIISIPFEERLGMLVAGRNQTRSTLITSQMPINQWYNILTDPTLADAILDRLVHNAYKVELRGDSMRKLMTNLD